LWGQIIQPLAIRSVGKNNLLGVHFLPHGAAWFFPEKLDPFSDRVLDLRDVASR
jgi:hypothetical protein